MSLVEKYLNIEDTNLQDLIGIHTYTLIKNYQEIYIDYNSKLNNENTIINIIKKLKNYIDNKYIEINIDNVDINYYIKLINLEMEIKFNNLIKNIDIDHIISMLDYNNLHDRINYKYIKKQYYTYFYYKIIDNKYKDKQMYKYLDNYINNNWTNITFENIINFTQTLNKIKYYNDDINKFIIILQEKFDSKDNIKKLINYINKNFVEENNDSFEDFDNIDNNKKYNFRFIIDNLKSNGFLLFEEYFIELRNKYCKQININSVKKEKKIINYFIKIISEKDSTNINRIVNEILIKIRDYIYDIEDNYYTNYHFYFKKLKEINSEEYKILDLNNLRKNNYNFNIIKYNLNNNNLILQYKLPEKIKIYIDMYKTYYTLKYTDRDINFDLINSTLVVKMTFNEKEYHIELALLQYIVMDIIIKNDGLLNIFEISKEIEIPNMHIQTTINSLLQIKLILRTKTDNIEDIKFTLNKNFNYEKNKISIASLILKEDNVKSNEFLYDKHMILLCNITNYLKKNTCFFADTFIDIFKYKVPFKITNELFEKAIDEAISKEYIQKVHIRNPNGIGKQIMYKYIS